VYDNVHAESGPVAHPGTTSSACFAIGPSSGPPDPASVAVRPRLDDAASVLSAKHPARRRRPVGQWNAIFVASSFRPSWCLACLPPVPFEDPALLGTVVAVPQFVPLLFIHSVNGALLAAIPSA